MTDNCLVCGNPRKLTEHPPPTYRDLNPWPFRAFALLVLAFVTFLVYTNPPHFPTDTFPPTQQVVVVVPNITIVVPTQEPHEQVVVYATSTGTPTPAGPTVTPKPACADGVATPSKPCHWPIVAKIQTPTPHATCTGTPNPGFDCVWPDATEEATP